MTREEAAAMHAEVWRTAALTLAESNRLPNTMGQTFVVMTMPPHWEEDARVRDILGSFAAAMARGYEKIAAGEDHI